MCYISRQTSHVLFKYYISKLGGGSRPVLILLTQGTGWGVQNLGKPADVILERSLKEAFLFVIFIF